MKISLQANGHGMDFSSKDIFEKLRRLSELEENFSENIKEENLVCKIAKKPTLGKKFLVNPSSLSYSLFEKRKDNFMQEWTRQIILKSLSQIIKYPEKYLKEYFSYIPNKNWRFKNVEELISLSYQNGNHIADWVEQSLEWAQRIVNGESWEEVCNKPDTVNWYRLILWKDNRPKIVGGSNICSDSLSATTVFGNNIENSDVLHFTVPLIVIYK